MDLTVTSDGVAATWYDRAMRSTWTPALALLLACLSVGATACKDDPPPPAATPYLPPPKPALSQAGSTLLKVAPNVAPLPQGGAASGSAAASVSAAAPPVASASGAPSTSASGKK